jgi:HNH endonuclease
MSGNTRSKGSRERILDFLLANQRRVLSSDEIRAASGNKSEWARRLRELRNEYGYQIQSHKDNASLRPGEYLLETDKRLPVFPRTISAETRAFVLERNGYTCQMCGSAAGDPDPLGGSRSVRLTIGHIKDKSLGGTDEPNNLRAVCETCNQGLQNAAPMKPDRIQLLKEIRRAREDDQFAVLEWLQGKFERKSRN